MLPHSGHTLQQSTHRNVTTDVNGMSLDNFYVSILILSRPKSVTVKPTVYLKKEKIHKIVFSWWNVKVNRVYNLSALCCKLEWLSVFLLFSSFLSNVKEVLLCQECEPATQTKLLSSLSEKLCFLLFIILF